jgi:hypothetical protein
VARNTQATESTRKLLRGASIGICLLEATTRLQNGDDFSANLAGSRTGLTFFDKDRFSTGLLDFPINPGCVENGIYRETERVLARKGTTTILGWLDGQRCVEYDVLLMAKVWRKRCCENVL